jgi:hypothetical protein
LMDAPLYGPWLWNGRFLNRKKGLVTISLDLPLKLAQFFHAGEKTVGQHPRDRTQSSSTTTSGDEQALPRAYYNVRAARAAATIVRTLAGCVVGNMSACGTFLVANDN